MKRNVFVVILAISAVALFAMMVIGDVHTAPYKTATVCAMCHKARNSDIVTGYQSDAESRR